MVKKIAFLFPGQGSQYVGMGWSYIEKSPAAKQIFDRADETLKIPLSKYILEGPEDSLKTTSITQPALFTVSAAALELMKKHEIQCDIAAGHSLGEYSALYAGGALSFENALNLVYERGKAMHEAGTMLAGTMAAILGFSEEKVRDMCDRICQEGDPCYPANLNMASQIVVSGTPAGVNKLMELAKKEGAIKVLPLNVSGAFHSPLMEPARAKMSDRLQAAQFHVARIPIIANVDAQPTSQPDDFRKKLAEQIVKPVRWHDTMRCLGGQGIEVTIEIGAGNVLTNMMKRFDRTKQVFYTDAFDDIEKTFLKTSA